MPPAFAALGSRQGFTVILHLTSELGGITLRLLFHILRPTTSAKLTFSRSSSIALFCNFRSHNPIQEVAHTGRQNDDDGTIPEFLCLACFDIQGSAAFRLLSDDNVLF